jgi:hypothetical protein
MNRLIVEPLEVAVHKPGQFYAPFPTKETNRWVSAQLNHSFLALVVQYLALLGLEMRKGPAR